MKRFLCVLCLCFFCVLQVSAKQTDELLQEQMEAIDGNSLYESLPTDTQRFLKRLGIESIDDIADENEPIAWLNSLWELLKEALADPLSKMGVLLAVVILCALVDSLRLFGSDEGTSTVFQTVSVLAVAVMLLPSLGGVIESTAKALDSLQVFMLSFTPVYATVIVTAGHGLTAAGFQGVVLLVAELLSWGNTHLLLPLTTASFGMGLAGNLNRELRLGAFATRLNRCAVWILGITSSMFVGLLSVKQVVNVAADSLGKRALRLSVASFIPVVGSTLSETVNTVVACLQLTRTSLGAFGMLTSAVIVLPTAFSLCGWSLLLTLAATTAELFALDTVAGLCNAASSTVKVLLALLCIEALCMILTVAIVTTAGGGA